VAQRNDAGFADRLRGPFSAVYMSVKPTRFILILPLPADPTSLDLSLKRVMNLGENRIEMRIPRSAWFLRDLRFPHS
jgi:hypothetical protein